MTKTTIKYVSLEERIEAIKSDMRERGHSFSTFIHDGIIFEAKLLHAGFFEVRTAIGSKLVYKTINL